MRVSEIERFTGGGAFRAAYGCRRRSGCCRPGEALGKRTPAYRPAMAAQAKAAARQWPASRVRRYCCDARWPAITVWLSNPLRALHNLLLTADASKRTAEWLATGTSQHTADYECFTTYCRLARYGCFTTTALLAAGTATTLLLLLRTLPQHTTGTAATTFPVSGASSRRGLRVDEPYRPDRSRATGRSDAGALNRHGPAPTCGEQGKAAQPARTGAFTGGCLTTAYR